MAVKPKNIRFQLRLVEVVKSPKTPHLPSEMTRRNLFLPYHYRRHYFSQISPDRFRFYTERTKKLTICKVVFGMKQIWDCQWDFP